MADDCIFCKIAAGKIPVKSVYEDEHMIAFPDINPMAPVHVLVIPRRHFDSLSQVGQDDAALMSHILLKLPQIAQILGIAESGFRIVANTGKDGGQSVMHLHWHLLGGRFMDWPPG